MKIVSIKKRNWFARIFTINEWKVGVEVNGRIKYFNCWGGLDYPSMDNILWDLGRKLRFEKEIKEVINKDL